MVDLPLITAEQTKGEAGIRATEQEVNKLQAHKQSVVAIRQSKQDTIVST